MVYPRRPPGIPKACVQVAQHDVNRVFWGEKQSVKVRQILGSRVWSPDSSQSTVNLGLRVKLRVSSIVLCLPTHLCSELSGLTIAWGRPAMRKSMAS